MSYETRTEYITVQKHRYKRAGKRESFSGEQVQLHDQQAAEQLLQEGLKVLRLTESQVLELRKGAKIDYIFVPEGTEILDAKVLTEPTNGQYPSDHCPSTATIRFK